MYHILYVLQTCFVYFNLYILIIFLGKGLFSKQMYLKVKLFLNFIFIATYL